MYDNGSNEKDALEWFRFALLLGHLGLDLVADDPAQYLAAGRLGDRLHQHHPATQLLVRRNILRYKL